MHTFEDRNIDYNNSPRGISVLYYLRDNIDLFASFGQNTFQTRTNPAVIEPDISIENDVKLAGVAYQNDYFDMHYLSMLNEQMIDSTTIENMKVLATPLGEYLSDDIDDLLYYYSSSIEDYIEYRDNRYIFPTTGLGRLIFNSFNASP